MITPTKPVLQVNFSGGRTSAFMAKRIKDRWGDLYELIFLFANTSFEDHRTLDFVDSVDRHFDLGIVWLEAVPAYGERASCGHRVVSYETAARNGEVFDAVAAKYGIPNKVFKWCTRELKENAMNSYMRSIGKSDRQIAIGIRADEPRRISPNASAHGIIYPLAHEWPTDKQEVLDYFEQFDWDLSIREHLGNCRACFQKSDRKLAAVYRDDPAAFDFVASLERKYEGVGPNNVPGPRRFFRLYRTSDDMKRAFGLGGDHILPYDEHDSGGCSESCEPYQFDLFAEPT